MPHSKARASEDQYDVFLSFSGADTRYNFTDFLKRDLNNAGIRVFMDDGKIEVGDEISEKIVQGIRNSKIYIPIISQTYPHRRWCLFELAFMIKNVSLSKDRKKIFPIFYRVEPGEVKHWIPHLKTIPSKVELTVFKDALAYVGQIKGWKVEEEKSQIEIFDKVVQKVQKVLGRKEESQTLEDSLNHPNKRCTGRGTPNRGNIEGGRSPSRTTIEIARMEDLRMEGGSIGKGEVKGIRRITTVVGLRMECSEAREEQWKQ